MLPIIEGNAMQCNGVLYLTTPVARTNNRAAVVMDGWTSLCICTDADVSLSALFLSFAFIDHSWSGGMSLTAADRFYRW